MPVLIPRNDRNRIEKSKNKTRYGSGLRASRGIVVDFADQLLIKAKILEAQQRLLSAIFMDGGTQSQLMRTISAMRHDATKAFKMDASVLAGAFVEKLGVAHQQRYENILKRSLGVDFAALLPSDGLHKVLEDATRINVDLIETIPRTFHDKVTESVLANFKGDLDMPLDLRLKALYDQSDYQCRFIARDQTAKLNASLTEIRHRDAGFDEYIWRTAKDSRVVGAGKYKPTKDHGDHHAREGKRFKYSKPPHDGHAGHAFNCRCYAEPVFELDKMDAIYV